MLFFLSVIIKIFLLVIIIIAPVVLFYWAFFGFPSIQQIKKFLHESGAANNANKKDS